MIIATIAVIGLLIAVFWSAWRTFRIEDALGSVMLETSKTTSMVFIILLGATIADIRLQRIWRRGTGEGISVRYTWRILGEVYGGDGCHLYIGILPGFH